MQIEKLPKSIIGFLQAAGLALYCALIGVFMIGAETWFGAMTAPFGMVLFLLLFVVSAVISAAIVLGYPAWLFYKKQVSAAIDIGIWTVFWILVIFLLFALGLVK